MPGIVSLIANSDVRPERTLGREGEAGVFPPRKILRQQVWTYSVDEHAVQCSFVVLTH